MNIIVAADKHWGIGANNQLLVSIPSDMKLFRQMTEGKVVVLGRKTLATFPNGLPLVNRKNIILTRNPSMKVRGGTVVHSVDEALEELAPYSDEDIFIIGGEHIYREFLPYCDVAHVTKIDHAYQADTFFPNLDETGEWEITADSEEQTYFDLEYTFLKYERKGKAKPRIRR